VAQQCAAATRLRNLLADQRKAPHYFVRLGLQTDQPK
jgi:hypothetical protein